MFAWPSVLRRPPVPQTNHQQTRPPTTSQVMAHLAFDLAGGVGPQHRVGATLRGEQHQRGVRVEQRAGGGLQAGALQLDALGRRGWGLVGETGGECRIRGYGCRVWGCRKGEGGRACIIRRRARPTPLHPPGPSHLHALDQAARLESGHYDELVGRHARPHAVACAVDDCAVLRGRGRAALRRSGQVGA